MSTAVSERGDQSSVIKVCRLPVVSGNGRHNWVQNNQQFCGYISGGSDDEEHLRKRPRMDDAEYDRPSSPSTL